MGILEYIERNGKGTQVRVYVAGPMRGYENWNYPLFNRATEALRRTGAFVVNPVEISRFAGTPEEIERNPSLLFHLLEADIALLKTCDAIVLLPGWEWSDGARQELQTALAAGLGVFEWEQE